MKLNFSSNFKKIDWWMVLSSCVLVGFGLMLIYSLTWPDDNRLIKQLVFFASGILILLVLQFFEVRFWRNAILILYVVIVILLMGLLLFGGTVRGIRGWISLGPIGFQVAEFAKIVVVLFLAVILEKLHFDLVKWKHILFVTMAASLPVLLIILQPDLGSAFIIIISSIAMVFYTGLGKNKIIILTLIGVLISLIGWFGVMQDYQKQRVLTFLSPQSDPLGSGYNVQQAIVAIGSGGLFGRGIGLGTQSQLNFLPEQETDFIFASLAEELGFIGSTTLLLIYLFFIWRIYRSIKESEDLFSRFLLLGLLVMFSSQAIINIGMNMGLFPVTGIPLPFVSYGGSSLIVSFISLGIIQNLRS
jgi:rod shape determining protein RodA